MSRAAHRYPRALTSLCSLLLAGCGSLSAPGDVRDSGPGYSMDTSHIPDVVPREEQRSRYGNPDSYVVNGKRYYVLASAAGYREQGYASWYGNKFHGRRTSSGEPYDMYKLTAAHTRLPIPSYVRVTNLDNHRSVVVRVNDRGPFHEGRIIDLSYVAASRLGIVENGTARVEVEAISPGQPTSPPPAPPTSQGVVASGVSVPGSAPVGSAATMAGPSAPAQGPATMQVATLQTDGAAPVLTAPPGNLYVQVGAFISRTNAERLREQLSALQLGSAAIQEWPSGGNTLYRVRLGPFTSADAADAMASRLLSLQVGTPRIVAE